MSSGEVASQSSVTLFVPISKAVSPYGAFKLISNTFSESEVAKQPKELETIT